MDLIDVLPFALAFFSLISFQIGGMVRSRVHTIMPWKDPATLILMLIAFSPFIGDLIGHHFLDTYNIWYLSFLISFVCCYSLAYLRGEFDMMYIAVQVISSKRFPNGATIVKPIVYYYGNDGELYAQEQSFREILKTVILGIRSPLNFPMESIRRTRPIFVQKVFFPEISVDAADVMEEVIKEEMVTKLRFFRFKVRSYSYSVAPHCVDANQIWMVNKANHEAMLKQLQRDQAALFNAKQEAMSGRIAMASDIVVNLMSDHTPEADVFKELEERLKPVAERRIRTQPESENPEVRHRSVFRARARDDSEETSIMEEDE